MGAEDGGHVVMGALEEAQFNIETGSGDDYIRIVATDADSFVQFDSLTELNTGGGDDSVELMGAGFFAATVIKTRGGSDSLALVGTRTEELTVQLGGGADMLFGDWPTFAGPTRFDGSSGHDTSTLTDYFLILPASVQFVSF